MKYFWSSPILAQLDMSVGGRLHLLCWHLHGDLHNAKCWLKLWVYLLSSTEGSPSLHWSELV